MSWSLALRNGDLAFSGSGYATVTAERKLVQDLRCYILERMGTDNMHPEFGSLIDGGRTPEGKFVQGVIGLPNDDLTLTEIEGEIRRLVNNYQANQLVRAKDDKAVYNKLTLTRGEILLDLTSIIVTPDKDTLNIKLSLLTASKTSLDLVFSFPEAQT